MNILPPRTGSQLLSSTRSRKGLTLQELARALHGDVSGHWINIPGPGHSSKDRTLGIRLSRRAPDGFLVNSFAGDDPEACRAHVTALLQQVSAGGPLEIAYNERTDARYTTKDRTDFALKRWHQALPAAGTLVEIYFQSRGIIIPCPWSLRYYPALRHPSGETWPAMIGLVTNCMTGEAIAIHRTFLAADGKGKAPVKPNKMMLGPVRGGVIRNAVIVLATIRMRWRAQGVSFSALPGAVFTTLARVCPLATSMTVMASPILS